MIVFKKLISLDEARTRIYNSFPGCPLGVEQIELKNVLGRVLAIDVKSPIDVPGYDRSTVDGFAVKSEDTYLARENNPLMLKLVGHVDIGKEPRIIISNGLTAEIVTGAPLPKNANAVVMVEHTVEKEKEILVYKPVAEGENIMERGSDIKKNELVLKCGKKLVSSDLGILAALGFTRIRVFLRPKVAILSTGSEIVESGKQLDPGKIFDINMYSLTGAVLESGCEPLMMGIVQDEDVEFLKENILNALNLADVVVTSGGVSVGPKDVVPIILDILGKPGVIIHGIAIKPGKPVAIASIQGKPIFSLPGNPTSSMLIFHLLVRPLLFRLAGKRENPSPIIEAVASDRLFSAKGRRTYVTVTLSRDSGRWLAHPVPLSHSGAITTLAKADGYVELLENQQYIDVGQKVKVHPLKDIWD